MKIEFQKFLDIPETSWAPCICCGRMTEHDVLSRVVASTDDEDPEYRVYENTFHEVLACRGCRTATYRSTHTNSEDFYGIPGTNEVEYQETITYCPPRNSGRRALEHENLLPADLLSIYRESVVALNSGLNVVAGIALRALLESVCKERKAAGNNLAENIGWLHKQAIVSKATSEILHKIRDLGNGAAHDIQDFGVKPLSIALGAMEHLLSEVYILPRLAAALPAWEKRKRPAGD